MARTPVTYLTIGFLGGCVWTVALIAGLAWWNSTQSPTWPTEVAPGDGAPAIVDLLRPLQREGRVPALGAAVVSSRGMLAAGTVGWRRLGGTAGVTVTDAWHIGSDAKAMTAMLGAILVHQGRLRWESRIAEVFPDLAPGMDPGWSAVTLDHLLCNRSGAPGDLPTPLADTRHAVVRWMTAKAPDKEPGTTFIYSNAGFIAAGAMMERVTGRPWEDLIATELWKPLGMEGCGFGGMGTPGQEDGLWGHDAHGKPVGNGPGSDNPPLLGPAGRVHLPLAAWARFVADQLAGARGGPALLPTESYRHLHQAWPGGDYARGWRVVERAWAKGPALTHGGSNTLHSALIWMAPGLDRAFLAVANRPEAFDVLDQVVTGLMPLYSTN